MVKACDARDRSMIVKSWRTDFLPSGEVIIFRGKGIETRAFIVVWNVGGVCGAWPITRHDMHIEITLECEVHRVLRLLRHLINRLVNEKREVGETRITCL